MNHDHLPSIDGVVCRALHLQYMHIESRQKKKVPIDGLTTLEISKRFENLCRDERTTTTNERGKNLQSIDDDIIINHDNILHLCDRTS